jgi:RND family efflux transporter MFP subunit
MSDGSNMTDNLKPRQTAGRRLIRVLCMYLLPLVVLGAGVMGAVKLVQTSPKAKQRPRQTHAALVQVQQLGRSNERAMIEAMGTVIPTQEIILQPRVSGEVVEINANLVPGGRLKAGEVILRIDPSDYELALEKTQSQIAQAMHDVKLEQGRQLIAQQEWNLLDMDATASDLDRELALRKPHLIKAEAALEAAQAAFREAQLNLERTTIRAPFNGIVTEENVDVGAQVSPQSQLGILVGTDTYWVRASVAVDELHWIRFPSARGEKGSLAFVRQELGNGGKSKCEGRVVRLMGDLEPQGRMARVLIAVEDPLRLKTSEQNGLPLLIGAYVNVSIQGREIEDVISVPRKALRHGDTVWLMNAEGRLEIRHLKIAWRSRSTVLVHSGLEADDRLVVSDLPTPVAGMRLEVRDVSQPARPDDQGIREQ